MKFFLICCFLSFTFSQSGALTSIEILQKAASRMDDISHEFSVIMESRGKKKKRTEFKVLVHWPLNGDILRETRIIPLNSKKKKPTSYWEQLFKNGKDTKRWMTLPITGKLKDVSHKKAGKKSFSFEELEITPAFIQKSIHVVIGEESVNGTLVYLIESEHADGKGSTRLWIDIEDFFIHKAEFYSKTGRLYRTIDCRDLIKIDKIQFPSRILVNNLKSNTEIQLEISQIRINPEFDKTLFIPAKQ